MYHSKLLLIDGTPRDAEDMAPVLAVLQETLANLGARVQTLTLRELKLGHCVGCFGCWLKTPGQCVQVDAGREVLPALLHSDTTVLFSPVLYGSYSPDLKRGLDRCLSGLNLPYLKVARGETHHAPRYARYPRLVGVGVQRRRDPGEAELFRLLVGRNALQLHAPSHAAGIVAVDDSPDALRRQFADLLGRADPAPRPASLRALLRDLYPTLAGAAPAVGRQALLLVGSPKSRRSTSAALGGYLLERLAANGWQTETLKLRAQLRQPEARAELLAAVDRADLIVLAFPLYNDSLPYLVLYGLQLLGRHRAAQARPRPQRLVAIANNGFPEPHHNLLALAVCRRFAEVSGLDWSGGLAVGGGEALSGGQPLPELTRRVLPPVGYLMRALDLAAGALAVGQGVPPGAARLLARNPIYPAPFASYRWIFQRVAARRWEREAAANALTPPRLRAQPF
jgi:multimeric flavodoxin WrbA